METLNHDKYHFYIKSFNINLLKNNDMKTIIRLALTAVVFLFIYKETGIATIIFCVLVTVTIELNGIHNKLVFKRFKDIDDRFEEILDNQKEKELKKSKWQERMEEMQERQRQAKDNRNKKYNQ